MAAFYLTSLVELDSGLEAGLDSLLKVEYSSRMQVLLYTVEMLGERAHHVLRLVGDTLTPPANLRCVATQAGRG